MVFAVRSLQSAVIEWKVRVTAFEFRTDAKTGHPLQVTRILLSDFATTHLYP
jgi:hypothetical protein